MKQRVMDNVSPNINNTLFEQIKQFDDQQNEWWSARQLSKILEYSEYRHFKPVIEKAKEACLNSEQLVEDHFEDFLEMVAIGLGAQRPIEEIGGEMPENLPPAEDVKKVQRKLISDEKKLLKGKSK